MTREQTAGDGRSSGNRPVSGHLARTTAGPRGASPGAAPTIARSIGLVIAATLAGVALWSAMRLCQRFAGPALITLPEWLVLALNAGIEEALRLGLAIAAAYAMHRLGLEPGTASLGVVASCAVAVFENASYLAAFPTLDAYWRLGYALPIHVGAAALYALATALPTGAVHRSTTRRAGVVAVAFAGAWLWHAAYNIVAALASFPALPMIGSALNIVALSALVVASAIRYGYWSIYAAR